MHRYLFRVLEQVAQNVYFANRSCTLNGGRDNWALDQSPFTSDGQCKGRKVLMTTGPIAYAFAIIKEMRRIALDAKEARGSQAEEGILSEMSHPASVCPDQFFYDVPTFGHFAAKLSL